MFESCLHKPGLIILCRLLKIVRLVKSSNGSVQRTNFLVRNHIENDMKDALSYDNCLKNNGLSVIIMY